MEGNAIRSLKVKIPSLPVDTTQANLTSVIQFPFCTKWWYIFIYFLPDII